MSPSEGPGEQKTEVTAESDVSNEETSDIPELADGPAEDIQEADEVSESNMDDAARTVDSNL